jgi:hypothetical protein
MEFSLNPEFLQNGVIGNLNELSDKLTSRELRDSLRIARDPEGIWAMNPKVKSSVYLQSTNFNQPPKRQTMNAR